MKQLNRTLSILTLSLALTPLARAFEFSPFSCDFVKVEEQWHFFSMSYFKYQSKLGWNQYTPVVTMLVQGEESGEYGICTYISSTVPEEVFFTIKVISGKSLNFADSCSFTGKEVAIDGVREKVTKINSYLTHRFTTEMNGAPCEVLSVIGAQENSEEPEALCAKAFAEATKEKVYVKSTVPQIKTNHLVIPNKR